MNEEVKTIFKFNGFVVNKNLEGISHEESLKAPDRGANCINWVLGHIVVTRDVLLESLGLETLCDDKITNLYRRGSESIKPDKSENLDILLQLYNDSQQKIMKAFNENDLKINKEQTEEVAGLGFHEAYHAGQIGVIRRVIGKEGMLK